MRRLFSCAILGAIAVGWLSAHPAMAQSTGTVRGVVRDTTGGVIPGAAVTLTNLATQQTTETVTTGAGVYSFAFLPPGDYRLQVEMPGFQTLAREPIVVNVAGTTSVDVTLEIGAVAEQVTVAAEAPLLQLDTSMLGGVVEEAMVTAVPLSSRNITQVLALSPGVMSDVPDASAFGRNSINISAHGARPFENSMILDGIVADNPMSLGFDDTGDKTGVPVPSPDAIEEFTVQTSLYDAETGRQGGAVVNVVTKSGGNDFKGTFFEFFRDDALNANEYFRKLADQSKPVLKQNQFGGTLGGPVSRNKAFFFTSYQGTRQKNGMAASSTNSVFLAPLGDRSAAALGALYGGQTGLRGGVAVAPDGSNINPVALAILNATFEDGSYVIPDPQILLPTDVGFSTFSIAAPFREDQIVGSVNYTLSDTQRLSAKGFYSNFPSDLPFPTDQGANVPGFGEDDKKYNLNLSASHTWMLNATSVNDLRLGYSRNSMIQAPVEPLMASDIGLTPAVADFPGIPRITVSGGMFSIGPSANNDQHTKINTFEISDTLNLVRGSHSIKLGGQYNPTLVDRRDVYLTRGNIFFDSMPDFLLGMSGEQNGSPFSNLSYAGVASGMHQRYPRFLNMAAFVQDDWRVNDRLALNLGLRWQFNSQQWDAKGRNGGWDSRLAPKFTMPPPEGTYLGFTIPGNAELGGKEVPDEVKVLPYNRLTDEENWLGFSPRLGVTWQPLEAAENLVVRAGWGMFYSQVAGTVVEQAFFDPWYVLLTLGGANAPCSTLQDPFCGSVPQPDEFPLFLPYTYPPTRSVYNVDPEMKQPRTHHWSVNVQQQIGSWLLQVGYVGSRGQHLLGRLYPNQALLASPENPVNGQTTNTLANRNLRVPILGWSPTGISVHTTGEVGGRSNAFNSRYDGLEVSVDKRYAQGLSLRASYTLSRATDNVSTGTGGRNQPLGGFRGDSTNPEMMRGPADYDRTHRFVASYLWDLPSLSEGNAVVRGLLGGWAVSGVTTIQSGRPFSVIDSRGGTIYGASSFAQFAEGMGAEDAKKSGATEDRLNEFFETSVFTAPPRIGNGTGFGNVPRNILRGPGQMNFDLGMRKEFVVGGLSRQASLEFRWEVFNLFNTAQFANPSADAAYPSSFGVISRTVVGPRIMQLALKYIW